MIGPDHSAAARERKAPESGRLERARFGLAHGASVYVQPLFEPAHSAVVWPAQLSYAPCWAVLDPGMRVEPHQHPSAEVYVFVQGAGTIEVDGEQLPVTRGVSVAIPPGALHTVENHAAAVEPLIWVSVGWRPEPEETH